MLWIISIVVMALLIFAYIDEKTGNKLSKTTNSHSDIKDIDTYPVSDYNSNKSNQKENNTQQNITVINNYYTQYNTYTQNNYYKSKKKKKSYTNSKTYKVKYSETGLANKLLENTGSKRRAKDILVEQYGYSQSEAKSLVGYRGY